jgi:Holliday junction DNA helicase RuvA
MIAKLTGTLSELDEKTAVIDTSSGVSYELFVTPTAVLHKQQGDSITVYTHLQVRDDAHVLFGFAGNEEKKFFHLLLTVSGVGPKTAFSIVSNISFEQAVKAVRTNSVSLFSEIPGIGKKTAMKIVLELSQKFKTEFKFEQHLSPDDKTVIDALIELGYKKIEAQQLFEKLPKELSIENKIQTALRMSVAKQ